MASITLYSNELCEFICYNINGNKLNVEQNDKALYDELKIKNYKENMISPIIFTDSIFIDYLLYVFGYKYILLRKFPMMDIIFKISFDKGELISLVNISLCKEYLYAVDNNSKKIYVIKNQKNSNQISSFRATLDDNK